MNNKEVIRILESDLHRRQDDLQMHIAAKRNIAEAITRSRILEIEDAIKFLERE